MFQLAISLHIVLPSCKVPHEVAPIHEVTLIRKEEPNVVHLAGHLYHHGLSTPVVRHF